MEAIQAIVEQAKPRWRPGDLVNAERDFLGALRGIIATSAISHGVDIERLNLMVFAGLPSDIAEYVQASSRVGRTHVGVCRWLASKHKVFLQESSLRRPARHAPHPSVLAVGALQKKTRTD
jgi:ATP-dependent helicase YprA (DUF1998 family)